MAEAARVQELAGRSETEATTSTSPDVSVTMSFAVTVTDSRQEVTYGPLQDAIRAGDLVAEKFGDALRRLSKS